MSMWAIYVEKFHDLDTSPSISSTVKFRQWWNGHVFWKGETEWMNTKFWWWNVFENGHLEDWDKDGRIH